MHVRSTALLLVAAGLPVAGAFLTRPDVTPPAPPALPLTWSAVPLPAGSRIPAEARYIAYAADGTGHVALSDGRLLVSRGPAAQWEPADGLAAAITSLVQLPSGELVATTEDNRILHSNGSASGWQQVYRAARSIPRAGGHQRTVVAAGTGMVMHSSDGGATWTTYRARVRFVAHDVAFLSERNWLVAGGIGQLLRTRDGGTTWQYVKLPADELLSAIAAVDGATLIAVGSHGTILRSADGGNSWHAVASPTTQHLRDVAFDPARRGVAVGMWGTLIVSRDGGRTWEQENAGTREHLLGVAFGADGVPVAVGTGETMIRRHSHVE